MPTPTETTDITGLSTYDKLVRNEGLDAAYRTLNKLQAMKQSEATLQAINGIQAAIDRYLAENPYALMGRELNVFNNPLIGRNASGLFNVSSLLAYEINPNDVIRGNGVGFYGLPSVGNTSFNFTAPEAYTVPDYNYNPTPTFNIPQKVYVAPQYRQAQTNELTSEQLKSASQAFMEEWATTGAKVKEVATSVTSFMSSINSLQNNLYQSQINNVTSMLDKISKEYDKHFKSLEAQ